MCPRVRSANPQGSNWTSCSASTARVGRPRIDDPDAAVLLRADGKAIAHAKFFLDMGVEPDETVAVMRMLIAGLGCRRDDARCGPQHPPAAGDK